VVLQACTYTFINEHQYQRAVVGRSSRRHIMRTWGRFIGSCAFDGGFLVLLRLAVVNCRLASAGCHCDIVSRGCCPHCGAEAR
jgi:hypothetical protein